ncbi:type II secretion system F family protein [Cellulomonas sp. FA1]|uniref:type II secretion system F family protein n=1 Tax=Cellulomonas sp. FA1 TaxID=1346710 RepID=UPI000A48FDC4|nr:type II secretion system F family protein [Cellulomonas sp. FA1]
MTAGLVAPTAGDVGPAAAAGVVVALAVLLGSLPWRAVRAPRAPGSGETGGRTGAGGGSLRAWRRRARRRADRLVHDLTTAPLDPAFVLDLCAAAVRGGAAVPAALVGTGRHLGGADGDALVRAGTALGMGAPWDVAWAGAPAAVAAVGAALRVGWDAGSSPGPLLRAAADRRRRDRRAAARAAAGALGVRLTLPLGACFLPAFVLLGLVPVVLGLAGDLLGR